MDLRQEQDTSSECIFAGKEPKNIEEEKNLTVKCMIMKQQTSLT